TPRHRQLLRADQAQRENGLQHQHGHQRDQDLPDHVTPARLTSRRYLLTNRRRCLLTTRRSRDVSQLPCHLRTSTPYARQRPLLPQTSGHLAARCHAKTGKAGLSPSSPTPPRCRSEEHHPKGGLAASPDRGKRQQGPARKYGPKSLLTGRRTAGSGYRGSCTACRACAAPPRTGCALEPRCWASWARSAPASSARVPRSGRRLSISSISRISVLAPATS